MMQLKPITAILFALLLVGCRVVAQDTAPVPVSDMPLLSQGMHLGTTFYGGGRLPDDVSVRKIVTDASAQGMNAFTFYEDWSELEPEPGVYDLDDLDKMLIWLESSHLTPLLNLTLIDVSDLNMPLDLLSPDRMSLRDGVSFDDPKIVKRLHALLDEIVPRLVQHGGFLLLLGNEVDRHFVEVNPAARAGYVRLIQNARDHVHAIAPKLAVGVTLTGNEVLQQGPTFQALRSVTDIIPFNYYPLSPEFTVLPLDEIPAHIKTYISIYGSGPVIIQELGCPSGSALESSREYQRQCFEIMFKTLKHYSQVRYVTVFSLFDWDEETCNSIVASLGFTAEQIPSPYFERIRDFLCTLGLLNADLSPKPAWDVFIEALSP